MNSRPFPHGALTRMLLAIAISAGLIACDQNASARPATTSAVPAPSAVPAFNGAKNSMGFQIRITKQTVEELRAGNTAATLRVGLMTDLDARTASTVDDADIEAYHWSRQMLTLTLAASRRIASELGAPTVSSLAIRLSQRAFGVMLNGNVLYAGVFLDRGSAQVIEYPVINPEPFGDRLVFVIRPYLDYDIAGTYSMAPPDWYGIRSDGIRARFKAIGKLIE